MTTYAPFGPLTPDNEPFDPLFPSPTQVRVNLPLTLLHDIRSALERSLEDQQELIAILSIDPDGEGLRPSERREIDHHSTGVVETQRLLDRLAGHCPEIMVSHV